jgi:glycerol-3-phosphate cytidylyltransferase-like family protein
MDFLAQCAKLGELTVGINTDLFVASFKPELPIMTTEERMHGIRSLGYTAVVNSSPGKELIEKQAPDILAIGSDWARKDYLKQIDVTQSWLDDRHIILAYIPYIQKFPISSTEIKRRIRNPSRNPGSYGGRL